MCIAFLYFNDNPEPEGYKLIIASNRDELYDRLTAPAQFWESNPNIIGGIDLHPGREGGTWFGITKSGKFGILTNYRQSPDLISLEAKGRGHLASDFLDSCESAEEYINKIHTNGHLYNGFNLLLGEISNEKTNVFCYCNMEEKVIQRLSPGFHALSNRMLNFPWPKIVYGKERFREGIQAAANKGEMIEKLFELLNERRRHFPNEDDTLYVNNPLDKGYPESLLNACRAIFVHSPEYKYGTRTNTVVVVDSSGHVTFSERTLADGANDPDMDEWINTRHEFDIISKTNK